MTAIAVTGAAGFLGRALVGALEESGHQVIELVRTPHSVRSRVVGEIGPDTQWEGVLEGVSTVIHCAARVHVMDDQAADALAAFRHVNVYGTRRLGEQAARAGVDRLVFVSSVKVNGETTRSSGPSPNAFGPFDLPRPEGPYAISKWEAELALKEVATGSNLEVVIIRPPLVYGPGVRANFLRLAHLVRRGVPLPFGSVNNLRSLIGIDNLVDALIRCATESAAAGQTFLVSDGDDLSTPDLVRKLAVSMGKPVRLVSVPQPLLQLAGRMAGRSEEFGRLISSLQIDISHVCSRLNWRPPISVDEGIRRAVRDLC